MNYHKHSSRKVASLMATAFAFTSLVGTSISLTGCSAAGVSVDQQPLTVTKYWIEDIKDPSQVPLKPGEEAVTQWKFGCKNDFDFEIVEQTQLGDEVMATVKIKAIKVTLTAPVAVYLPKKASAETIKHEDAHVLICKRVYAHAQAVARETATSMLNREFQASGKTLEDAVRNAITVANAEVSDAYHLNSGEEVRRVSEILDSMDEHNHDKPLEAMVDQAFGHYTRVSGDVRLSAPPVATFDDSPRATDEPHRGKRTDQSIKNEARKKAEGAKVDASKTAAAKPDTAKPEAAKKN